MAEETPALDRLRSAEPPTASDSDLVVVAINRLQRAVVKMQSREYDDELQEHLERAAEFLGWVATNIWLRDQPDPEHDPNENEAWAAIQSDVVEPAERPTTIMRGTLTPSGFEPAGTWESLDSEPDDSGREERPMNAEALATGLAKYWPEWWGEHDIQHMVSNIIEDADRDRGSIAQEMWTMGAWLKHPKCRNDPKRGNDADYSNECETCETHLLVVADALLLLASEPHDSGREDER